MINKLKHKFQIVAMICVVLVMIMFVAPTNTIFMHKMENDIDVKLKLIADNDGTFPAIGVHYDDGFVDMDLIENYILGNVGTPSEKSEVRYGLRNGYYSVQTDNDGHALLADITHINNMDRDTAMKNAEQAVSLGIDKGYIGSFKYLIKETGEGKLVVFLDCFAEQSMKVMLLIVSFGVAFLVCATVLALMRFFSVIAIKPFAENINNQRRFITDAGHELKTPLAIISANAEVLEMTMGQNEWLDSIKNQTVRMNELVKELVYLCKYSEKGGGEELVEFSISDALKQSVESFSVVAETKGKRIASDISDMVKYKGNEESIRRLFSILLDNAVKYASDNSEIKVGLSKHGKSIKIVIENECDGVDEENISHVFERFYRTDSSRTRETGGFGIGLSIAQAIVDSHKGRINVKSIGTKAVAFTVIL